MIMARGRNYDKQIKAEAVSLVIDNGKTIASVARELEIPKSTVGEWVENYKGNGTDAFIGWAMSGRMTKALVIRALKRAFQTHAPTQGLIHHSDRGSQYAALDYQALLQANGITTSMSRKDNCYDNTCIESFHSIIKKEQIHQENYATRAFASRSILEYIVSFYNYERIHSYIDYLSPIEFEKRYA